MLPHDAPAAAQAMLYAADGSAPTWVDLAWYEGRIEHWIRFGRVRDERILDRRRRQVAFQPGDVFAFVRWQANPRGTVQSRVDILRAVRRSGAGSTTPGVHPGAERLLHIAGWPKVQRVLAAIDAVEALGLEAVDAAPDYWRHLHNRLTAHAEPDPYTLARHRAWRLRAGLGAS